MTTKATWARRAFATVGTISVAGALVLTVAPGASSAAPSSAGLSVAKAAVDARINLRLATLGGLKIAVNGATDLASGDKSTLSDLVSSDATRLAALKTKTDAETTIAAVKADAHSMIVDYRVYLLVVPKVRFNIVADKETATIARLASAHDKLAALATQLAGQGKDTTAVQAKLDDMTSKLAAATSTLGDKAQTLLGVAPSQDAAAMKAAVAPVRTAVKAARGDIKAALADAKAARDGLKALSS